MQRKGFFCKYTSAYFWFDVLSLKKDGFFSPVIPSWSEQLKGETVWEHQPTSILSLCKSKRGTFWMFLLPLQGVNPIIRLLPRVLPWSESRLGLQPASTCNQRRSCHCGAQAQWPMPSWRTRPPLPPREQRPCRRGHDELALQGQKHSAQGNALRNGWLSTFRSVRAKETHAE